MVGDRCTETESGTSESYVHTVFAVAFPWPKGGSTLRATDTRMHERGTHGHTAECHSASERRNSRHMLQHGGALRTAR